MRRGFLTLLTAALISGSAWASGYQVLLQSNRSTGMGNLGVGLRPDPSAINFNPGALAIMRENGIQAGANLIYGKNAFRPTDNPSEIFRTDNPTGTPFHLYAAFGPADAKIKFGLGVYTPYGSTVNWEEGWVGRFSLTQLSLTAIYIQPTVSFRLSDNFSVGAGVIYSIGSVNLQRDIDVQFSDGSYGNAELDGKASGWGYNLGLYYTPSDKLSLGLSYRSRVDMKVKDGTATFNVPDVLYNSTDESRRIPESTSFTSELPLPDYLTLGASFRPFDKLTLGADISLAGWNAYKSLRFEYAETVRGESETEASRNYKNSWTYKFGAEYAVAEAFKLRAGAYYDQTPVQEGYLTAETPDANTVGLTAGFGLAITETIALDASFLYINKEQRENTPLNDLDNPLGTYKSVAYIPGVSLTVNF